MMSVVRVMYQMAAGHAVSKTLLPKLSEQTSQDFVSARCLALQYRPNVAAKANALPAGCLFSCSTTSLS